MLRDGIVYGLIQSVEMTTSQITLFVSVLASLLKAFFI